MKITKKIALFIFILLNCLLLVGPPTMASGADNFKVYVTCNGKNVLAANYSVPDLQAMKQALIDYSSIDASGAPSVCEARGVMIDDLLASLGIRKDTVSSLAFASSDGWRKNFTSEILTAERYYYPQIVSGYDKASQNSPEFSAGAADEKQSVLPMLALESYEGRYEGKPDIGSLSSKDGLRFCFGQKEITDCVSSDYGKFINSLTIVMPDNSEYVPPSTPAGTGTEEPAVTGVPEDDADNGLASDTLTITVGYMGGPYYTKKVFTLNDLKAMNQVRQEYTFIDNMPAVVLDSVVGVRLTDILAAAGIDVNSVETFHFYCADVTSTWYTSITKDYLIDTRRYYYPYLPERWDYDNAQAQAYATEGAVAVDTLIAYEDNWKRFATAADYEHLTSSTRFRLIFGQTDTVTHTASRSAKWIHTIEVMLGGSPPPAASADKSALTNEVGSQYQTDTGGSKGQGFAQVSSSAQDKPSQVEIKKSAEAGTVQISEAPAGQGTTDSIIKNASTPDSNTGSIQNWRMYDMSETAVELPKIILDNPLTNVTAISAGFIFIIGGLLRGLKYYRDIGGKRNAHRSKPK